MTDRIDVRPTSPQAGRPLSAESAERLDKLFRLYNRRVVALARTRTRSAVDAQDVAAETWFQAARSLSRHPLLTDDTHAWGWLAVITRRTAIAYYRPRRSTERPMDFTDAVASQRLPASRSAEDVALGWLAAFLLGDVAPQQSSEHEKTKDPLPTRPPRKHPQGLVDDDMPARIPPGAPRTPAALALAR